MQPLQAQVSVSQLRDDPDFNAMAPEIQVQYLSEEFLPKADPTFNQLPANLRSQYIQEEVMPQIRPVEVKGVGDTGFGQDLRNQFSPVDKLFAQGRATQAKFAHDHPFISGATDVLTGRAFTRGALQGLSAGGYTPGAGGTLPNQIADTLLGMPNNNPVSNALQSAGQMVGGFGGVLGLSPVLGPMGAGGLFFGSGDLNSQLDQGRNLQNLNYGELAGQTALGAAGAKLPAAMGGKLPTKLLTGAMVGGGTNAVGNAINQFSNNGSIDFTDPAMIQAFMEGIGPGAAFGAFHTPGAPKQQTPIGLKGTRQIQGRVEAQATPWGLDRRGQTILKNVINPARKAQYEQAQQRRAAQVAQRTALPEAPQPEQMPVQQAEVNHKQIAQDLHALLNSEDAQEVVKGQALKKQLQDAAKDKTYRSGKVKQAGSADARTILAELSIIQRKPKSVSSKQATPDQKRVDLIVKTGKAARQKGGEAKARFDNYLDRNFDKDTKRIVNERIGSDIKQGKESEKIISAKVSERIKKRKAKADERRKEMAKAEQEAKKAKIKADNERLAAELKKQKEEDAAKNKPSAKSMPKVLSAEEIELQAEQLFQHHQKAEKGTLEAKVSKYRSAAKTDFSKSGAVDKARSDAINETHARVLDRFAQKKAEADTQTVNRKKPENVVKARAENLKELEDTQKAGGSYDFNSGKGKQKPVKASQLKWKDVRDSIDDPELQAWGDTIDEAMKNDGVVRVRYDAERVGDTGEFEYKELSPLDWGFNFTKDGEGNPSGTKVVFHAVNKNGHTGEYYLQPSDANPKTGTVSGVLEAPVRLTGKTAYRNTDPNVYKGQRDFKIGDVMSRPPRRVQGLTSETQAKLIEARALLDRWEAGEPLSAKDAKKAASDVKKAKTEQQNGAKQQNPEGAKPDQQTPKPGQSKNQKVKKAAKNLKKASEKSKVVRDTLEAEKRTSKQLRKTSSEIKEAPNQKPIDEATNC